MNCNYKTDENLLRRLVDRHIAPAKEDSEIKFHIYYKTRKLSRLLIQNSRNKVDDHTLQHHVVNAINAKGMDEAPLQHITSEQQHVRCTRELTCISKMAP